MNCLGCTEMVVEEVPLRDPVATHFQDMEKDCLQAQFAQVLFPADRQKSRTRRDLDPSEAAKGRVREIHRRHTRPGPED